MIVLLVRFRLGELITLQHMSCLHFSTRVTEFLQIKFLMLFIYSFPRQYSIPLIQSLIVT